MAKYVYISGLNQDESLGIFRELVYILRSICVDGVGQQVGKRGIADVPRTMTTDEEVREPLYIILLVEPEGTVTAVVALLEASVFADMSFPIMIHYCIDRKFSLKPMAVA